MKTSDIFQERINIFEQKVEELKKKSTIISWSRVLWFLVGASLISWLALSVSFELALLIVIIFILGFAFLVRWYNQALFLKNHQSFLAKINQREIAFGENDFDSEHITTEEGNEFIEKGHPYLSDLDIFGKKSLFWLLNRSHTETGKKKLANWLKKPAEINILQKRQEAVDELNQAIEFSQDFEAKAMHYLHTEKSIQKLLKWEKSSPIVAKNKALIFALYFTSLLSVICIFLSAWQSTAYWLVLPLLINAFIWRNSFKKIGMIYEQTFQAHQALKTYKLLLETLEKNNNFKSERLISLKEQLYNEKNILPSKAIKHLSKIIYRLSQRQNLLFTGIANGFFLWDFWQIYSLEKWKKSYQNNFEHWFEIVAEFEALNSLAGFYRVFEADLNFPNFSDKDFYIEAKELGHPLIPKKDRVCNNITIEGLGQTLLITGSNMSGKTTFERTLGINIVLSLAGSAVLAQNFHLSRMQVFTSMRTQDSLQENLSSFYAELKRLNQLINSLKEESTLPIIYLLDEILKGTNSADRHKGAEALIYQLHVTKASGLVSTHDLELGKLAEETNFVKNYHFRSDVENGKVTFDYQLREGLCHSFNATELMQMMGIEIKKTFESK